MALGSRRTTVIVAFATLYLVWGSTYLGMRYAVESIPPLLMAGARFLLAGVAMFGIARARGAAIGTREEWRSSALVGCLLMGGNACVAVAVTRIPSGVAALIVAMSALWFVVLDWLRPNGRRPRAGVFAGLVVGLAGVGILIGPGELLGGEHVDTIGAVTVLAGTLVWSGGSIYSRHVPRPQSPLMTTAAQMMSGGAALLLVATLLGEAAAFDPRAVSLRSLLAFVYLFVFGSLIAFTAYVYLLQVSTPTRVSTYAYVNPLVAVFLGWAFGGEAVSPRVLVAAAVIIGAVALITSSDAGSPPARREPRDGTPDETRRAHSDEMPVPDAV